MISTKTIYIEYPVICTWCGKYYFTVSSINNMPSLFCTACGNVSHKDEIARVAKSVPLIIGGNKP